METLDCIATRRSVRKYLPNQVEWDKIGTIIYAGMDAPSAGNLQNWSFIIITDLEQRNNLAQACIKQTWMAHAPVHIIVCALPEKASKFYGIRGERLYSIQNCAAATQNMTLAANDLGLGTCWVSAFDEEQVRSIASIPKNVRPQVILTLGYPNGKPKEPSWKHELYTVAFIGSYGGRIKDINHVLGYHSGKVRKIIDSVQNALNETPSLLKKLTEKGKTFYKQTKEKINIQKNK